MSSIIGSRPTTFRLEHSPAVASAAAGAIATNPDALAKVAAVPTTGTSNDPVNPSGWIVSGAFGIVIVVWVAAFALIKDKNFSPTTMPVPVAGLTIFGVFFVAAQAIERLLEPIASFFVPAATTDVPAAESDAAEAQRAAVVQTLVGADGAAAAAQTAAQNALDNAASKKAALARSKANRKIVFWAIASAIAVLASASLKLYLLNAVGVASAPRALDILATGLIIGGGTGPLHDLVTLISAKADTSKAAAG